ncbi:unnamed protein product, partial [Sphagnum troendelagicum]
MSLSLSLSLSLSVSLEPVQETSVLEIAVRMNISLSLSLSLSSCSSSGVQLASGRRSEVAGETDGDFNDVEDDESATSITRIPVPRQKYIAVSKVELVSTLLSSCPSSKEASALLEIFSCLESVLHAEHKSLLEELRMDYRLAQSSLEDEMSSSSSSTSKAASSENNHTMKAA